MKLTRRATAVLATFALLPALTTAQLLGTPPEASAAHSLLRPADGVYRA